MKKLTSLHDRIAEQLDDVLNGRKVIAEWMTLGKKIVELKDPGNRGRQLSSNTMSTLYLESVDRLGGLGKHVQLPD